MATPKANMAIRKAAVKSGRDDRGAQSEYVYAKLIADEGRGLSTVQVLSETFFGVPRLMHAWGGGMDVFHAAGGQQTANNSSAIHINWPTLIDNPYSFVVSGDRVVPNVPGRYKICAKVAWSGGTNATASEPYQWLRIKKNSTSVNDGGNVESSFSRQAHYGGQHTYQVFDETVMAFNGTTDFLNVAGLQSTGRNTTTRSYADEVGGGACSRLMLTFLSPLPGAQLLCVRSRLVPLTIIGVLTGSTIGS